MSSLGLNYEMLAFWSLVFICASLFLFKEKIPQTLFKERNNLLKNFKHYCVGLYEAFTKNSFLEKILTIALIVGSVIPLVAAYQVINSVVTDDAYITLTYAKSLAEGRGFVFQVPPQTLGTTTPFFTFVTAGLGYIFPFVSIQTLAVAITAIAWIGSAWLLVLFKNVFRLNYVTSLIVSLTILVSGTVFGLGMESHVFNFLLIFCLGLYFSKRYFEAGFACGLLFLTRGEGVLLLGIMGIGLLYSPLFLSKKDFLKTLGLIVLGFLVPFLIWSTYAMLTFGAILTNTLGIKVAMSVGGGHRYFIGRLLLEWMPRWGNSLVLQGINIWWLLTILGLVKLIRERSRLLIFVLWIFLYVLGYTILRVSGAWWYQLHILLVLNILAAVGVTFIVDFLTKKMKKYPSLSNLLSLGIVVLFLYRLAVPTIDAIANYKISHGDEYLSLSQWFRENTEPEATVAYHEIGFLGYFSERQVIDLVGLIHPESVPYIFEGNYAWIVWEYEPDYFVHAGNIINNQVIADERFTELYEEVAMLTGPVKGDLTIYKRK